MAGFHGKGGSSLLAEFTLRWVLTELRNPLVLFGFAGQFVFFMRFVVQLLASERKGRSHVPVAFWWISVAGSLMTLAYAILKGDLVFSVGQALGLLIYLRNLWLIYQRAARYERIRGSRSESEVGEVEPSVTR